MEEFKRGRNVTSCVSLNSLLPIWQDVTNLRNTDNNIIPEKDIQTGVTTTACLVRIQALENAIQLTTNESTQAPNKISYSFPSPWQLRKYFKVSSVGDRVYFKCNNLDPVSMITNFLKTDLS